MKMMAIGKKTLLNVSTALMVSGGLIFLISFSTMAWSKDYTGLERQGIWRECVRQLSGKFEVYALCGKIKPRGWVRGVQFFETVAFLVLIADLALAAYRFRQGPTEKYTKIQMILNFVAASLILLGVVVQGSATNLPKPGYSFYLALFAVVVYVISAVVNIYENRHARSYIGEYDDSAIFGITTHHRPPTVVQGVALVH